MTMLRSAVFVSVIAAVFAYSHSARNVHYMEMGDSVASTRRLGNFSHDNCNTTAVPIFVKDLNISPEIIQVGHVLVLNASVIISKTIPNSKNINYDLDLLIKVGGEYRSLCDLLDPSVCHGKDVCALMASKIPFCPPVLRNQGFNCDCPIKKTVLSVKDLPIPIPSLKFDLSGQFKIVMKVNMEKTQLMCFEMEVCIKDCE